MSKVTLNNTLYIDPKNSIRFFFMHVTDISMFEKFFEH